MEMDQKESEYRWLEAAKSYERKLISKPLTAASSAAYWEKIGFCYALASRQAKTAKDFKKVRQQAVVAYEKAAQLFEKENQGKQLQCLLTAEYTRAWIATSTEEKRKTLERCRAFGKKTLRLFKKAGDRLNYAKTCNTLALCAHDLQSIVPTSGAKRKVIQEGLAVVNEAIAVLSMLKEKDDLVFALSLSSILHMFLANVSNQEQEKEQSSNICLEHSIEAIRLSKETANPYTKAMSRWARAFSSVFFEERIEESSLEHAEEMLRHASIVRDNYLRGIAFYLLAGALFAEAQYEIDPARKKQTCEDIIAYSEKAIRLLRIVQQDVETAITYLFYTEGYTLMAREVGITPDEKRCFIRKAVKTGEKGLRCAISSGSPFALESNFHALSKAYYFYSVVEPEQKRRINLLKKALEYRKKDIESIKEAFASNNWYLGTGMVYIAQIKAELARIEKTEENKIGLIEDAILCMEQGILNCKSQIEFAATQPNITTIARYEDVLGDLLEEHYFLTKKPESLRKSNEIFLEAAENFKKVNLPSRVAESYWKIAKNQDFIGDYQKASENFANAAISYELSAQKIRQFNDFYLNYSKYMDAWSEIELAKSAHKNQHYDIAKLHYENSSNLLNQSDFWNHLASNFYAWAFLEDAEYLSRRESCRESIESFEKSIKFFRESERQLNLRLDAIDKVDERALIKKLIKVSHAREEYNYGRIAVEEAKILDKQGNYVAGSEKYGAAARIFKNLCQSDSEQIRNEAKPLFYLCQAWQKMTMAEARVSSKLYREAAELFEKVNEFSTNESASLLALAHSSFCKGLAAGTDFELVRNPEIYIEAKKYMNIAAASYLKAGFETYSEYAKATQRLFDAYIFMDNAKRETDPEKEAKHHLMAEKVLTISVESYNKANYTKKANQVERLLKKIKEDKALALSLSEVFHAHPVTSSTASFTTMGLSEEKAVGLERFAHGDIRAKMVKHENGLSVGQDIDIEIHIVNVGKEPVLLTGIENIVPIGFQLVEKPEFCHFEDSHLICKGKKLDPLKEDYMKIVLRPYRTGSIKLKPSIICVDATGSLFFHNPKGLKLDVSKAVLPGRIPTGYSDLDDLLLGGIPENYAVVLISPSSDKRDMLINKFLEIGARSGDITICITSHVGYAKTLAEEFPSNFHLLVCNPKADIMIKDMPNVLKLDGVENLTNIGISLIKVLRALDLSYNGPKRACIQIISDVLLQHHAVITRKWLISLLAELRSKGFTTLAVINPQMHSQEEVEAIIGEFEGVIQICEKDTKTGLEQLLRVKRLYNSQYLENDLIL
jgi:KaiC/GvpD/RAD55 family RecA-like ATPase